MLETVVTVGLWVEVDRPTVPARHYFVSSTAAVSGLK